MRHNIDLIFRTAGVAEVELAAVITNNVKCVVVTGGRDKKASCAAGEISVLEEEILGHVGPQLQVSRFAAVKGQDGSQAGGSRLIPHLCHQAPPT